MQIANPHLVARYQQILQSTPRRVGSVSSGFEEGTRQKDKAGRTAARLFPNEDRITISPQAREILSQLASRDREVRAHEAAHAAAGGSHAGSPVYEMEKGPDGRSYAVGGEVSISTSPVAGEPEATLGKAEQVRRAALAPAQPSAADRSIAARATNMASRARMEISREQSAERDDVSAIGAEQPSAGRQKPTTGRFLDIRA